MKSVKLQKKLILTSLFAALICSGCFIHVPLPGGVPIALQDMLAMLSGLLLGPFFGSLAVLIFLLLGAVGLPVFTGKAGLHVLLNGPTSGFLWGYLAAAFVGGLLLSLLLPRNGSKPESGATEIVGKTKNGADEIEGKPKNGAGQGWQWVAIALAALVATLVLFVLGVAGGMFVLKIPFAKAMAVFVIPFIPGNVVKIVLMVLLAKKFRPVIFAYTN